MAHNSLETAKALHPSDRAQASPQGDQMRAGARCSLSQDQASCPGRCPSPTGKVSGGPEQGRLTPPEPDSQHGAGCVTGAWVFQGKVSLS